MGRHSMMKAAAADAEQAGIPLAIFARQWFILATLCGRLLSVMIANGGVNLALPSIATEPTPSTLRGWNPARQPDRTKPTRPKRLLATPDSSSGRSA